MTAAQTRARGVVTPEAVVLDFETAGVGSRVLAAVIDGAIQGVLFVLLFTGGAAVASAAGDIAPGVAAAVLALLVALFIFGYPIGFETLWRGRTPGKAALGLRVVTVEGAPERFRHAAVRALLGLVEFGMTGGALAVVSVFFTRRNQRLGDLVAGTIVLRERTAARMPTAIAFSIPPGFEAYAATLDVSGITDTDYGAIRSFLVRAPALDRKVRDELARSLSTTIAARVRHSLPPALSPELFLVCVAARYQQRSGGAPIVGATTYRPEPGAAAAAVAPELVAAPRSGAARPGTVPAPPPPAAAGGFSPPA